MWRGSAVAAGAPAREEEHFMAARPLSLGLAITLLATVVLAPAAALGQGPPTLSADEVYVRWLETFETRQAAALRAVPQTLDLGNPTWRRDQALALDSWGALIQEARDQRAPATAHAVHTQLLQAAEHLDRGRRLLVAAVAVGQEPGPEMAAELTRGQQVLEGTMAQARALTEGRGTPAANPGLARGNLRISVVGVNRPYVDRGAPFDPAWEYLTVRLRLENVGGEPVVYDAYQFRLRAADDTLQRPVPLSIPDELLYGALEGNRLAGSIVGEIAYPIRRGVTPVSLVYQPVVELAVEIPLPSAGRPPGQDQPPPP
jgi:hypothetical protein